MNAKVCPVCGNGFVTENPKQMTCSVKCRQTLNGRKNLNIGYRAVRQCQQCGTEYEAKSEGAKYCSKACVSRAWYRRNKEARQAYDRKKIRRVTIGLNIRNEHLQRAAPQSKWLWDGTGPWSRDHRDVTDCLECNTHVFRHKGNGVCEYCWDRLRSRDPERMRVLKTEWARRKSASGGPGPKAEAESWIGLAEAKKIPITPKIGNLLDNLHALEREKAAHA